MLNGNHVSLQPNICIGLKDRHFRYAYCNENFAEFTGLSPTSIVGKTDFDLFEDNYANIYRRGDIATLRGNPLLNQYEVIHSEERKITTVLTTKNVLEYDNKLSTIFSFIDLGSIVQTQKNTATFAYIETKNIYHLYTDDQRLEFTAMQYKVLKHILQGKTTKGIGLALGISHRTVEYHIKKIKATLQCSHKNQIMETTIRLGLNYQMLDQ